MKKFSLSKNTLFPQVRVAALKEIFRKSIHIASCFVPPCLFLLGKDVTVSLLLAAAAIYLISEILRYNKISVPLISKVTQAASRPRDEGRIVLGPLTLIAGIVLSIVLFPAKNAQLGILSLAFGDGFASLVGKLFGTAYIPFSAGKTAEGSLSCFFAAYCACYFSSGDVVASLILSVVTMVIELLPLFDFDNIAIPVAVSFISFLLIPSF